MGIALACIPGGITGCVVDNFQKLRMAIMKTITEAAILIPA